MASVQAYTGTAPARVRYALRAYQVVAWFTAACVVVQIFVAGMAIFVDPGRWAWHRSIAHGFEIPPLLLIVLAFVARLPARMRWLSVLPFVQLWLQYATSGIGGMAGAFHPVNALLLFWVLVTLAQRAGRELNNTRWS